MALWQFFEKTIASPVPAKVKEPLLVPTIVVTPVLEEQKNASADDVDFFDQASTLKAFEAVTITEVGLPTPPASPPTATFDATGLGISGVDTSNLESAAQYKDPLNEVDDLLEILGLNVEEERDELEDEVEQLLAAMEDHASKLVTKSKAQFLELSRQWNNLTELELLPAKREAKMIISESYAMEGFKKDWNWTKTEADSEVKEKMSRDDRLFSAIVLADSASPACQNAHEALRKVHNLQNIALSKYATRLKDHKVLSLATYRRYVRRVKRTEREMDGWKRKQEACGKILEIGEKLLDDMGKEPGSPDSGYEA